MAGICLNPYGCEWSIWYFWRLMTWLGHLDVIVLTLLLAYTLFVVIWFSYRCHTTRRVEEIDSASRWKLASELSIRVGNLKSIASAAPYLGLVGTCFGIMSAFRGIGMERHAALAMMSSLIAAALITTAAGIVVAVPATCSYNYLHRCLDSLVKEVPTRRLPLEKLFSEVPAFGQIAAPALAVSIAAFVIFSSLQSAQGLHVRLTKTGNFEPENHGRVEPVLIRLSTSEGRLAVFVNSRRTPQDKVKDLLQASPRRGRMVNIAADKEVRWADVANAIDVAKGLDGDVVLLTAPPNTSSATTDEISRRGSIDAGIRSQHPDGHPSLEYRIVIARKTPTQ